MIHFSNGLIYFARSMKDESTYYEHSTGKTIRTFYSSYKCLHLCALRLCFAVGFSFFFLILIFFLISIIHFVFASTESRHILSNLRIVFIYLRLQLFTKTIFNNNRYQIFSNNVYLFSLQFKTGINRYKNSRFRWCVISHFQYK